MAQQLEAKTGESVVPGGELCNQDADAGASMAERARATIVMRDPGCRRRTDYYWELTSLLDGCILTVCHEERGIQSL